MVIGVVKTHDFWRNLQIWIEFFTLLSVASNVLEGVKWIKVCEGIKEMGKMILRCKLQTHITLLTSTCFHGQNITIHLWHEACSTVFLFTRPCGLLKERCQIYRSGIFRGDNKKSPTNNQHLTRKGNHLPKQKLLQNNPHSLDVLLEGLLPGCLGMNAKAVGEPPFFLGTVAFFAVSWCSIGSVVCFYATCRWRCARCFCWWLLFATWNSKTIQNPEWNPKIFVLKV